MEKTIVLVGPTGVGKTELSLRLAEHYGCAIINADSRQIYRDLPIGTAAPTADEQARVKHYLVGTHALEEEYNAGQFVRDAEAILSLEKAIISGGAMLYVNALLYGIDKMPEIPAGVRKRLNTEYTSRGLEWLQAEVAARDPRYWETVDRQNPQRLLRCLEVCEAAGVPYSDFRTREGKNTLSAVPGNEPDKKPYLLIGLTRDRDELYDRINQRVDIMLEQGLEEEARRAYGRLKAPTVGYAEMFQYFEGKISREEAIRLIKQNSRHYAKRQLTWWRRNTEITWLEANKEYEENILIIDNLLHPDRL